MTVTDSWNIERAKAINSESYSIPTHNIFATTPVATIDTGATSLGGTIGTGVEFDSSRVTNVTSFTAIRSGTDVISATGDTLRSVGMATADASGTLLAGIALDELQTTAFDLEFAWDITSSRR